MSNRFCLVLIHIDLQILFPLLMVVEILVQALVRSKAIALTITPLTVRLPVVMELETKTRRNVTMETSLVTMDA